MNRLVAAIRGHFNNAPGPFRTIDYASYHEKTSPDALPDSRALRLSCDAMERDVWGRAGDGVRCTGPPLPHGGWATPSPRTTIKTDHSSGARDSALHGNIELTNGARLLDTFLNEGTVSSGMVRDSTMGHVQLVDALVISSELCAISMVIGAYVRNSILVNSIVCCGAKVSGCRLINTRVCGGELKECKEHGGCLVGCNMWRHDGAGSFYKEEYGYRSRETRPFTADSEIKILRHLQTRCRAGLPT